MNVLVCVKRVPVTGGRIVLTDDEQEIDTRFLGFAVTEAMGIFALVMAFIILYAA